MPSNYADDQPQEHAVVELLAQAYNAFCALPRYHPSEVPEFTQAIHVCQMLVMSREAVRNYPDTFPNRGPKERPPVDSLVMRSSREE